MEIKKSWVKNSRNTDYRAARLWRAACKERRCTRWICEVNESVENDFNYVRSNILPSNTNEDSYFNLLFIFNFVLKSNKMCELIKKECLEELKRLVFLSKTHAEICIINSRNEINRYLLSPALLLS